MKRTRAVAWCVALTRSRALQTQDLGYVVHKSQVESKARAPLLVAEA
jgi:hypothetical protein